MIWGELSLALTTHNQADREHWTVNTPIGGETLKTISLNDLERKMDGLQTKSAKLWVSLDSLPPHVALCQLWFNQYANLPPPNLLPAFFSISKPPPSLLSQNIFFFMNLTNWHEFEWFSLIWPLGQLRLLFAMTVCLCVCFSVCLSVPSNTNIFEMLMLQNLWHVKSSRIFDYIIVAKVLMI